MIELSAPSLFVDYFRIPFQVAKNDAAATAGLPDQHPLRNCVWLQTGCLGDAPRFVGWAPFGAADLKHSTLPERLYELDDLQLHCRPVRESVLAAWLGGMPGNWRRAAAISEPGGRRVASVWRDDQGNVFLPFDPDRVMLNYWSEAYRLGTLAAECRSLLRHVYYSARPVIPRPAQIGLRQLYAAMQARMPFPHWPIEPSLHDFYSWMLRTIAGVAHQPVPWLSPWPHGHSWALILTHDVETSAGYANKHVLRNLELRMGFRSSWNFSARRYQVDDEDVRKLTDMGFEVGVHGLYHDGWDLGSLGTLQRRLPEIRACAERWGSDGFRAPALHRVWEWMPLLGFSYDSSYPDTDPYEPQPGGCCSSLPFFIGDTVELPVTLTQDHTLFVLLKNKDEALWLQKAAWLRAQGGMALLITHPDYMVGEPRLAAYRRFLEAFSHDDRAWKALPRDVATWWRQRSQSSIERIRGRWEVRGPAADRACIRFATPDRAIGCG